MVNYKTNKFLKGGASFDTEGPTVFKPGQNNGQITDSEENVTCLEKVKPSVCIPRDGRYNAEYKFV